MSKITEIFDYFRTCPQLSELWSIAATEDAGVSVIIPQGSSQRYQYRDYFDVDGGYNCDIIPFASVYEDYQINCYRAYDSGDKNVPEYNINVLSYEDVMAICDWVFEQNENGNLPVITGESVVAIECNPFVPQVQYVNEQEGLAAYFITVRVRYVNKATSRSVEC